MWMFLLRGLKRSFGSWVKVYSGTIFKLLESNEYAPQNSKDSVLNEVHS